MNGESVAIIAVILLMGGIFLRAKRKGMAILTLPLISVPLFHLLTTLVYPLARSFGYGSRTLNIGLVVIGAVLGAAACSLLCKIIVTQRSRNVYLVLTLIFQVAIAIGYIINLM